MHTFWKNFKWPYLSNASSDPLRVWLSVRFLARTDGNTLFWVWWNADGSWRPFWEIQTTISLKRSIRFTLCMHTDHTLPSDSITTAVLLQEEPCDVAVNFTTYRSLQRHRAVSLAAQLSCTGLYISVQRPFKCWNYTKHADFHSRDGLTACN